MTLADPSGDPPPAALDGPAAPKPTGPISEARRIETLDVLRGVAVLGILAMNIQSFAMVEAAYFNPYAYGDLSEANLAIWLTSHLLADQKFLAIFSMLFGAGIVLMAERREAAGLRPRGTHYRRMGCLLLFGFVHGLFIWSGDILTTYALCGLWVYPMWRLSPTKLTIIGAALLALPSGLFLLFGLALQAAPPDVIAAVNAGFAPGPGAVASELETYRGSYWEQMSHRAPNYLFMNTVFYAMWGAGRAGGLMLLGMAMMKTGLLTGRAAPRVHRAMIAVALLLGLPISVGGAVYILDGDREPVLRFFIGSQFNYWASIALASGYTALIVQWCRRSAGHDGNRRAPGLRSALAGVGRMALTNYLMQSVLCTLIFFGHGLGLIGRVDRLGQLGIVLAIWAAQLVWSPMWLNRFRFGPAEWLWRSLTYGRPQPMRR